MVRGIVFLLSIFSSVAVSAQTFRVSTTESDSTLVEFLFTDSLGRIVTNEFTLRFLDTLSGKTVATYTYAVDSAGKPARQASPAGMYDIGSLSLRPLLRHVPVLLNQKNTITANVPNGTLRFRYELAPQKPMSGVRALVRLRFTNDTGVFQNCDEDRRYPPGDYYVEMNTVPITRFNTDIDPDCFTELQIRENGSLMIQSRVPSRKITLCRSYSDLPFVKFLEIDIGKKYRLQLKPGKYQVVWSKSNGGEGTQKFWIASHKVTHIVLD